MGGELVNNEDKILAMLERMEERQSKTESILVQIQADVTDLKADVTDLKSDMVVVKADISEIKEQVQDIDTSIGALAEWADSVSAVTRVPFAGSGAQS